MRVALRVTHLIDLSAKQLFPLLQVQAFLVLSPRLQMETPVETVGPVGVNPLRAMQ